MRPSSSSSSYSSTSGGMTDVSFVAELSPAGALRPLPFRLLTLGQAITTSLNGSLVRGSRHTEAMAGLISSASVTGHDKWTFGGPARPSLLLSYKGSPANSAVRASAARGLSSFAIR
jgi:hypothetical protein